MPQTPNASSAQSAEKPCYPQADPQISCDGITAKAAVDQALDADKAASAVGWQLDLGVATLGAAIAAAVFAWLAAHHTKRSADVAENALAVTRQTSEQQLRAYLGLTYLRISDIRVHQMWATFKLTNAGQTPAYEVKHFFGIEFTEDGNITHHAPQLADVSQAPIAPGGFYGSKKQLMTIPEDIAIDKYKRVFQLLQTGKLQITVFGWFEYKDIFGKVRKTEYCLFTGGPLGCIPQVIEGEIGEIIVPHLCSTGNGAD